MKSFTPISIVIPNYNGIKILQKHLRSVVDHAQGNQIIIVDDASTDQSVAWVQKKFPQVKVIVNSKNSGFSSSVNAGFHSAEHSLVFLLNNDVSINKNTIPRLLSHFENRKVFAVGCLEKLKAGKRRGRSIGSFQRGLLIHSQSKKLTFGPTLWVFGASGMFRKSTWDKLNGMDTLFHPAYYEDIDLGYRAWKAGYTCYFEPSATVEHEAEVSFKKALGRKKNSIVFKNQILFFWKNVREPKLWLQHILWLPYHLLITSYRTKGAFILGFFKAIFQIPQLLSSTNNSPSTLTDTQVIKQVNTP